MFESAETGHKISKKEYKLREPLLRSALLKAQYDLLEQGKTPVIILVNGVDGAGKGETVNLLNAWMDPRHIRTEVFVGMSDEERKHPEMWRFWQALPSAGHISILFGSWYTDPILAHVMGHDKTARFEQRLERIRQLETMLVADGAIILKFWFHLSRTACKKRLKDLESDPKTAWRVTPDDWAHFKHYNEFTKVCAKALHKTSTRESPWHIIEGSNAAYRSLTTGQHILDAIQARLSGTPVTPKAAPRIKSPKKGRHLLQSLDYTRTLAGPSYEQQLETLQGRLNLLTRDPRMASRSLVIVFEGMDAAGKGSTLRRITQALDARHYRVVPIAAPTGEEHAHPYLWRFWRHIPEHGKTVIFDRSWYGRVLVERVENFCSPSDWMRAYNEINEFEDQLIQDGAIVIKFWLAITPEEQLRRFKERQKVSYKNFKITDEDWRNREKWPLYEQAVEDMVERTSPDQSPWHLVASDNKRLARIEVLQTICRRLETALNAMGSPGSGKNGMKHKSR